VKTSGTTRIAERYVKALFDVAQSSTLKNSAAALDSIEKDLAAVGRALDESADFRHFLTNPLLTRQAQAGAVKALLAKMKAQALTQQFMATLAHQRRLGILPEIIAMFTKWAQAARGEMAAELIVAAPMKDKETALVAKGLGKAYGKTMNLTVRQDASLLGGIMVKIGSLQLDGSLAGKLARLNQILRAA